jgi:hypothetical protein
MSAIPGFYAQPVDRTTFVEGQLISGFTTVRLRGALQFAGSAIMFGTVATTDENLVRGVFMNTGLTAGSVQLVQVLNIARRSDDGMVSGPRQNIGLPIVLQPGGRVTRTFTPNFSYLEMDCSGGGPTTLRAQLTSRIQYQQMALDRTEGHSPQAVWAVQPYYTSNPASR